jgi:hypothetical protein
MNVEVGFGRKRSWLNRGLYMEASGQPATFRNSSVPGLYYYQA